MKRKRKSIRNGACKGSNGIIKQTDFLIISVILSIIFGITAFLNKKHLIVSKKHAFFQTYPTRGWKDNNTTNETLLSRKYNGKITEGMSACLLVKDENNNLPVSSVSCDLFSNFS